jgi:hypothetical protein
MTLRPIAHPGRFLPSGASTSDKPPESARHRSDGLFERVSRAKARWLRRVMYETPATSTEKCLAYAIADHLNCVTMDCWPGQTRLAKLLDLKSTKSIQRAAQGLVQHGVLTIMAFKRGTHRYSPVFLDGDEDMSFLLKGNTRPSTADRDVRESYLSIHPNISAPTEEAAETKQGGMHPKSNYRRQHRGSIEVELACLLGPNGFNVLGQLSAVDDRIVERLCRSFADGLLGERELAAARLAARQMQS